MPFLFTVKTVLSTVDKNEDKTMPAWFQVQEFLYVQSNIVWILVSYFITFSVKIGFGDLDTQS